MSTRTAVRSSARRIAQHKSIQRQAKRFQSANAPSTASSQSHLISGLTGGGLVVVAGYAWYHFSGTKQVVQTARSAISTAQDAKNKVLQGTPSLQSALGFLRSTVHTYAATIPGGGLIVDRTFDQIDKIAAEKGDQAQEMIMSAYTDLQKALSEANGKDAGEKVMAVVSKVIQEVEKMGASLGDNYLQPLIEKNPALKKALESSYGDLQKLADKHGPQANKIYQDTSKQLSDLVNQGINGETIAKAVALVKSKSAEIQKLAAETSKDAWASAEKSAAPILQKLPDLRSSIDESLDKFSGTLGKENVQQVKDMYGDLAKLSQNAKGKDSATLAKEAKDIAEKRVKEIQQKIGSSSGSSGGGVSSIFGSLAAIPGMGDLGHLKEMAEKKGPEAEKLLEKTYADIKSVLEKRVSEAKDIASKGSKDS